MNTNQFTQKTMEALQAAQRLAIEYSNQALEQEHMLVALTQQQDGLIPQLLTKMNVDPGTFEAAAAEKVSQLPHVTGSGRDPDKVYISNELDQALTAAEKQAQQMKDEYISVEHVFMGMLQRPGRVAGELFKQFGITPEKFMQVLSAVRGNQRVTTDNPESTYDALTAQDLSYYDETLGSWYAAPGEYKILLGHSSRDIHATLSVRFSTPRRRPFVIDENTTIGELSKDDRTAAIIQQVLAQAGNALTGGNAGGSEIASSEAVAQMLDSMPLRGIVNFGGPAAAGMITPLLEVLRAAIQ